MKALLIYRAPQFSPNSIEKDRAILQSTGQCLLADGTDVAYLHEENLSMMIDGKETDWALHAFDLILTMGRLPETISLLRNAEQSGVRVINSAEGLAKASRCAIEELMHTNGIPAADSLSLCSPLPDTRKKYWVKRGDMAAQSKADVQFAEGGEQLQAVIAEFQHRGITQLVVTEHVEGDLVKFYGVQASGFFRTFYPTDDGQTKFNDEQHNGESHHYAYDEDRLHCDAERLSRLTRLSVYGGDAIIRADGTYAIIDFNDWPSFSRCREEAAQAIARIACS